jgi:hypothetical protein
MVEGDGKLLIPQPTTLNKKPSTNQQLSTLNQQTTLNHGLTFNIQHSPFN